MINKKLLVKFVAMGLMVASVAGATLTFVQKSSAHEVTGSVSARAYMRQNIDNLSDMSDEEFYEVFGNEEFQDEIGKLLVAQNKRGGGSLKDKLNDLTDGQLDNLADKIWDIIPTGAGEILTGGGKNQEDDTDINTDEPTDEITDEDSENLDADDAEVEDSEGDKKSAGKGIIKQILKSIKKGMDTKELTEWLVNTFKMKEFTAKVIATVTVGALDVIVELV